MSVIHSFLKLNYSHKIIIIKALLFLWIIRIMLWILPFSKVRMFIKKFTVSDENNFHQISMDRIIWAVEVMSIYTPGATCLTRASAASILLATYDYPSSIKIGVSKNEGEFESHAWLEANKKIILGESETEYTPILNMGEKT